MPKFPFNTFYRFFAIKYNIMSKPKNWLKFIGIIRRFVQTKYNMHINELETLLFLNDEEVFRFRDIRRFAKGFVIGNKLIGEMTKKGYIVSIEGTEHYQLSIKGKQIIKEFYGYIELSRQMDPEDIEVIDTPTHRLYSVINNLKDRIKKPSRRNRATLRR